MTVHKEEFKELAQQVIDIHAHAALKEDPEVVKLGMAQAGLWADAYRTIFNDLKPKIEQCGVIVPYRTDSSRSYVDDVVEYARVVSRVLMNIKNTDISNPGDKDNNTGGGIYIDLLDGRA